MAAPVGPKDDLFMVPRGRRSRSKTSFSWGELTPACLTSQSSLAFEGYEPGSNAKSPKHCPPFAPPVCSLSPDRYISSFADLYFFLQ